MAFHVSTELDNVKDYSRCETLSERTCKPLIVSLVNPDGVKVMLSIGSAKKVIHYQGERPSPDLSPKEILQW